MKVVAFVMVATIVEAVGDAAIRVSYDPLHIEIGRRT